MSETAADAEAEAPEDEADCWDFAPDVEAYNAVTDRLRAYGEVLNTLAPRFDEAEGWKARDDRQALRAAQAVRNAIIKIARGEDALIGPRDVAPERPDA